LFCFLLQPEIVGTKHERKIGTAMLRGGRSVVFCFSVYFTGSEYILRNTRPARHHSSFAARYPLSSLSPLLDNHQCIEY
jgi:hypothetical protein